MNYYFDSHGWYTSQAIVGRVTEIAPPSLSETTTPGQNRANWVGIAGAEWQLMPYSAPPPAAAPAPVTRVITKLAFRNRFTQAEKVALEIAALDVPAATLQQRSQAAALRVNQADVQAATFIDLSRADTRAGVQALEAGGLLAAGRALQILDAPIQDSEVPIN